MKKAIEIKPLASLAAVPHAGFYELAGILYVASVAGSAPFYVGPISQLTVDHEQASVGISEQTLLKAIAIAQNPQLAAELVKGIHE